MSEPKMTAEERVREAAIHVSYTDSEWYLSADTAIRIAEAHAAAAVACNRKEELRTHVSIAWRDVWARMGQSTECAAGTADNVIAYVDQLKAAEARHDEMRQDVLAARRERDEHRVRAEKAEARVAELEALLRDVWAGTLRSAQDWTARFTAALAPQAPPARKEGE